MSHLKKMSLQAIVCRCVCAYQQNCMLLWRLFVYAVLKHVQKLLYVLLPRVHSKEESILLPYRASKISMSSGEIIPGALSKELLNEVVNGCYFKCSDLRHCT